MKTYISEALQDTISKYLSPKNPQRTDNKSRKFNIDDLKDVRSSFISPKHSRNSRTVDTSLSSLRWSTISNKNLMHFNLEPSSLYFE